MLRNRRSSAAAAAVVALAALALVSALPEAARAQAGAPVLETKAWPGFPSAPRIDGAALRSGFVHPRLEPGSGSPDLARTSPMVAIDAYTALLSEIDGGPPETIVNESYVFTPPTAGLNRIRFVIPIKVPAGGLPGEMWVDAVVIPCRPRTGALLGGEDLPPAPSPRVFIDDVRIGDPGTASTAYTTFAFFDVENLESAIGSGDFDWFCIVEFNSTSLSDLDGDLRPDIGIEANQGGVLLRLTPTIDEVGASVIEFFAGNVNRVNVYEPAGVQPPARPGFGGQRAGETGVTRPWCFRIN